MAWIKWTGFKRRNAESMGDGSPREPHHDTAQYASVTRDGASETQGKHGIVLYGTPWCGDCRRARRVFADMGVAYAYIDIEDDPEAMALVMRLNHGMRSVPTIIFPDGSVLVEPGNTALAEKLVTFAA